VARGYSLRASDSDREDVVERLRAATAEGRLLVAELEQRLEVAFSARTCGELDALVADLPAAPAPPPAPVQARRRPGLPVVAGATLALGIIVSTLGVAATTGFGHLRSAVQSGSSSIHGRPGGYYAGPGGLFAVLAPLMMIVFLVVVCTALGWLFSQSDDATHSAPNA
jgi:hypothetical protein